MRANFFVMFPTRDDAADVPVTYIARVTARRRSRASTTRWRATSRTSPTIDVSASIAQVQGVLDQVIRAVEFLFGFTLAAGAGGAVRRGQRDARGARARVRDHARASAPAAACCAQVQRAELLGVGLLAGLLASLAAIAVGWALARYAFDFSWTPSPWVPLAGARRRRAARARGRLVGPARGAGPAGGRDLAPGGGRVAASRCEPRGVRRQRSRRLQTTLHAGSSRTARGVLDRKPARHTSRHADCAERTPDSGAAPRRLRTRSRADAGAPARGALRVQALRIDSEAAFLAALGQPWDVIVSDYNLPGFSGLFALELLKASGRDVPFILVSGEIGEETAVEAMRNGASDYLLKTHLARLVPALLHAVERAETRRARAARRPRAARVEAAPERAGAAPADQRRTRARGDRARDPRRCRRLADRAEVRPRLDRAAFDLAGGRRRASPRRSRR